MSGSRQLDAPWKCQVCGHLNTVDQSVCNNCVAERPGHDQRTQAALRKPHLENGDVRQTTGQANEPSADVRNGRGSRAAAAFGATERATAKDVPTPDPVTQAPASRKGLGSEQDVPFEREGTFTGFVSHGNQPGRDGSQRPHSGNAGAARSGGPRGDQLYYPFRLHRTDGQAQKQTNNYEVNLKQTKIYMQEGDRVTVAGKVFINHTSRTVMAPEADRRFYDVAVMAVIFLAIFGFAEINLLQRPVGAGRFADPYDPLPIAVLVIASLALIVSIWSIRVTKRAMKAAKPEIAVIKKSWRAYQHTDPTGVVEGVYTFSRRFGIGRQTIVSKDYMVFRIAVANANGEVVDRLTFISKLDSAVRAGDTVRVPGKYATGRISKAEVVFTGR